MSALSSTRPITLDEFERLPDIDGVQELLDGLLIQMPPPKRRHSEITRNIFDFLKTRIEPSRVWIETGFLIGRHCPQPDIAVTFPEQTTERGWFAGSPILAIEVASRGNTPDELEWKKDLYLSNGALEVWVIYDKTRSIVVHTTSGSTSHTQRFTSRV